MAIEQDAKDVKETRKIKGAIRARRDEDEVNKAMKGKLNERSPITKFLKTTYQRKQILLSLNHTLSFPPSFSAEFQILISP